MNNRETKTDLIRIASIDDEAAFREAIREEHLGIIYELVKRLGGEVEIQFPLTDPGRVEIEANKRTETIKFKTSKGLIRPQA